MTRNLVSIPPLFLSLGLSGCSSTWSPKQIDKVAARCEADARSGSRPFRSSHAVGIPSEPRPTTEPVVVYGASWCSACRIATAYLARRGILYVERDVEEDPGAAVAARAALGAVGLRYTGAIPVVDVRGTVTLGFFPCVVEQAWFASTPGPTG